MLEQQLEVQPEPLVIVLYFRQLPRQVVVAVGHEILLKTVHLAVLVVVVLPMAVLVVLVLVGKEIMGLQVRPIKAVVVAALVLSDQLMAMAATGQHLVFLVPQLPTAVAVVVVVALLKHPLVRVVQVAVAQGLVVRLVAPLLRER